MEDGLYKFKKSFIRTFDCTFSIEKKPFDDQAYKELVAIRKSDSLFDEHKPFFPLYRA